MQASHAFRLTPTPQYVARFSKPLGRTIGNLPMLPVILAAGLILSGVVHGFMTVGNLQNIMRQLAVILVAVSGETLVLLIGGIDLSVGATIGLASVCGALSMHYTNSALLGLMVCIGVGAGIGGLNGVGIAAVGLQPFIVTFGTMLTVRAVGFLLTQGRSVGKLPKILLQTGRMRIAGLPLVFIIGISTAILVGLVLKSTCRGEDLSDRLKSARGGITGRQYSKIKFRIYLTSGALAGLAAFVFMMRLGAATPTAGDQLLLQIIGAVVWEERR